MWEWIKSTAHDEFIAFVGLFVVAGVFFTGGLIGDFFGVIGDRLFGKTKGESTDYPD